MPANFLNNNLTDVTLLDDVSVSWTIHSENDLSQNSPGPHLYSVTETNGIFCCMTVFNEPGIAILVSIASVIRNLVYLRHKGEKILADNTTLCIIIDGIESLSETARALLIDLDLFKPDGMQSYAGTHIHDNQLDTDRVTTLLSKMDLNNKNSKRWAEVYNASFMEWNGSVSHTGTDYLFKKLHLLLCIKTTNKGKLDSHWWFFKIICAAYNPKYCLQMDAGTAPKQDAVFNSVESFKNNPKAGAIASMILISPVKSFDNILHIWQSGDFIYQKLMNWPAEVLFGYLTVIPGQFCLFRWNALYAKEVDFSYKEPVLCQDGHKTPLENYFRGLKQLGPFESNMFLAEDRILGFEIISNQKSGWNLTYIPSAVAITDPCDSLNELLRQRRRWNNSCHTCYLWLKLL